MHATGLLPRPLALPATLTLACISTTQAERLNDESVKLRILQASLTIMQSQPFADEQVGGEP